MRVLRLGVIALAFGCRSFTGPNVERVVGVIPGLDTDDPAIEIPDTVQAGALFTVTIHTGWRDGCAAKGDTQVQTQGQSVTVTPYDIVTEGEECGQAPEPFTHTATLRFLQAGTARVIVRGRASYDGEVLAIQREVSVR